MELDIFGRFVFSTIGSLLGVAIGFVGWWLYGLANAHPFSGPGMDPLVEHWLSYSIGGFGFIGLVLRDNVITAISGTIGAIFNFESARPYAISTGKILTLALMVLVVGVTWFTVPTPQGV